MKLMTGEKEKSRWLVLFLVLTVGQLGSLGAQEQEIIEGGRYLYHKYCAACHGPRGEGDGPMATSLRVKPADLTRLAENHGGTFPFWETYRIIDGREHEAHHGRRDMPVWGQWFRIPEDDMQTETDWADQVRGRLWQLLSYLQTIQKRGARSGGAR